MADVTTRFRALPDRLEDGEYNYEHFRAAHLVSEIRGAMAGRGIHPGQAAPDFSLTLTDGATLRLHEMRGKPVLLKFTSYTCPFSASSVEPMKRLYDRWGNDVQFVEVLIRQAHPGPGVEAYNSFERKMEDARRYAEEEGIPWMVAVDDVEGKVHQVYGSLTNAAYLIDSTGRVSFYSLWTNVPALNTAIGELMKQERRGVVADGIDRRPRLIPVLAHGWPAIRRGLPQSYIDLETTIPGSATVLWLGWLAKGWLEESANRIDERPERAFGARVLPAAAVAAGAVGGAMLGLMLYRRLRAAGG